MKKYEIVVGSYYRATVSGNIVTVRVDAIEDLPYGDSGNLSRDYTKGKPYKKAHTAYYVTILGGNNRKEVFRSPNRFRCVAKNACGSPIDHNWQDTESRAHETGHCAPSYRKCKKCGDAHPEHILRCPMGEPTILRDTQHPEGL